MTTDQFKSISTKFLNRDGIFEEGVHHGHISWGFGQKADTIGFIALIHKADTHILFEYTETDESTKEITPISYKVSLVSTPCHYGNKRWWFICPLGMDGQACNRRVGILYLRGRYFGCRHCHDLTYTSCQESHKYDTLAKQLGFSPDDFKVLFKDHWKNEEKLL
jgi:hypothetical protein